MSTYQAANGLRRDDFVAAVRPDPKSNSELVMLQGYVGESDIEGHVRLYADSELTEHIDVAEKDINHSESVSFDEDPLGGSRVWLKKTAVFTAGDPGQVNRIKSTFLEGDIMSAFKDLPSHAYVPSFRSRIACPTGPVFGPQPTAPIICERITRNIRDCIQANFTRNSPVCPQVYTRAIDCRKSLVDGCRSMQLYCQDIPVVSERFACPVCVGVSLPRDWKDTIRINPGEVFQQFEKLKVQVADIAEAIGQYSPY